MNYRTVYMNRNGWKLMYGCIENAHGGDTDAWFVTNTGDFSGAVLYAPEKVTCPNEGKFWWYKRNSRDLDWTPTR